ALDDQAGLGWSLRDVGGVLMNGHTGGTIGQQALLACVPARSFALVVLTNSSHGSLVHQAVLKWTLAGRLGIQLPEPRPEAGDGTDPTPYLGVYESPGNRIAVSRDDGVLTLQ